MRHAHQDMIQQFLKRSLAIDTAAPATSLGLLLLRAGTGALVFYVHGLHKLEGGISFLHDGTPWQLAEEVAAMHVPLPVVSAFAATAAQLLCAPLLAAGLFTRINAAILTATLGVAVLQNLGAHRDPQLALLYECVVASLVFTGGGRWSLDALLGRTAATAATVAAHR